MRLNGWSVAPCRTVLNTRAEEPCAGGLTRSNLRYQVAGFALDSCADVRCEGAVR